MGLLEDCSEILEKLEVVKNEIQKTRKRIRDVTYVPEKGCFLCKEGGTFTYKQPPSCSKGQ